MQDVLKVVTVMQVINVAMLAFKVQTKAKGAPTRLRSTAHPTLTCVQLESMLSVRNVQLSHALLAAAVAGAL